MVLATAVALNGMAVAHFLTALALVGLGWNFMYTGATTLLTESYTAAEKARAQGLNDFIVFVTMAVSSLGSGVLVSAAGWNTANWVALPVLAAAALAVMLLGWHRRESSSSMRYLATVQRAPSRITRLFSRNIDACARCALRLRRPTNARDTRQSHAIAAARA